MNIFAHRGIWKEKYEQNSLNSLLQCVEQGYSIETDIWRVGNELIISHDPPTENNNYFSANYFMDKIERENLGNQNVTIAWNVKSDACESLISELLSHYEHLSINHFFFDMSIPAMIALYKLDSTIPLCTRVSDVEYVPVFLDKAAYIWLDSFFDDQWLTTEILLKYHTEQKHLVVVSPELHKRKHQHIWNILKEYLKQNPHHENKISICTDYPELATHFFGGKQND